MEYLDFEVEIDAGSGREYPVAVIRSPAGEARSTMTFPFEEHQLTNHLQSLEIALLRSSAPARRRAGPSSEEEAVREFGKALFEALLPGDLGTRYVLSRARAAANGKGLRFKLRIRPPELASLPWEFLYDPVEGDFVCLSRQTPLVRHLETPQSSEPLAMTAPLRVLAMVASPSDLPHLDTAHERSRMEQALKPLIDAGHVELVWLEGQTWRDLNEAMWKGPWHILHFIGHGGFDPEDGRGVVVMAGDDGKSVRLGADQVARLVNDHDSLRLVLLNSCEGARADAGDVFSSSAATLVRRGVPAVLAMQYEITDGAAIEFSRTFYEAIASGMPVDAAVSTARLAISIALRDSLEWGTPVLYMRSGSGVLFNVSVDPALVRPLAPPPVEPPPTVPEPLGGRGGSPLLEPLRELVERRDPAAVRPFHLILRQMSVSRWSGSALFFAEIQNHNPDPITVRLAVGEAHGIRVDVVPEVVVDGERTVSVPIVANPLDRSRFARRKERRFVLLANDDGPTLPIAVPGEYDEPANPAGFIAGGVAGIAALALGGLGLAAFWPDDAAPVDATGPAQIAFVSFRDGVEAIYMRDENGENETHLSPEGWTAIQPAWSPDGSRLAFASPADGDYEVYVLDIESREYTKMTDNPGEDSDPFWHPDGSRIGFYTDRADDAGDLWVVDVETREAQPLAAGPGLEDAGSWSSDGERLAFVSARETGVPEIFLAGADGADPRRITGLGLGSHYPQFRPGNDSLVFSTNDGGAWDLWRMDLDGEPEPLTTGPVQDRFPEWDGEDRIIFASTRVGGTVACTPRMAGPCADQDIYAIDAAGGEPVRLLGTPAYETEPAPRPR